MWHTLKPTVLLSFCISLITVSPAFGQTPSMQFGFARANITPQQPLRLSGYGNRTEVFTGIDEKLFARAMAVQTADKRLAVLISVDTIGFPGTLSKSIAETLRQQHGLSRDRVVICSTHSHTAPQIADNLENIFSTPLTTAQARDTRAYTKLVAQRVVQAAGRAIKSLAPGRLYWSVGKAGFARNRRALKDGKWIGFSGNPDGPVDHSLPVLKIVDAQNNIRGIVFNYACHCTTFGSGYNRVNGDWAGYAVKSIEQNHPGAIALCTIGCGADQNPVRDNDGAIALKLARAAGSEIAEEIKRLTAQPMREITSELRTSFGFAGLPIDRPSNEDMQQQLKSARPQNRRHAENMIALKKRMGRLPETYPAPVQVWRFGRDASLVFLGGEVVVDYALRLKKELKDDLVWVSAYSNDVFAYVASERMRAEGGYEFDSSMIYYGRPGPWLPGAEEVLIRRVHELVDQGSFSGPSSPEEALKRFHLTDGYAIDIVAAEPLIRDPVNFAVGADGRLWVVEMGDYPRGTDGTGAPGGRVKVLTDVDGDGRYDKATLFLDKLGFPTGVLPWKDGALVSGAPDIIFAQDTSGDGRADKRTVLFTGFDEANPQHRVSGFTRGLDNWLYLASGTNNRVITSARTGEKVNISGRDSRIRPDQGVIETTSGQAQFGRSRTDWGDWFGNNNSRPLWHYVIDDRYLGRNKYFPAPSPQAHLLDPPTAPRIYPTSRTLDRFNDLFALNRFTSACSPLIFRSPTLGADTEGNAFVCEPVHNLVHRSLVVPQGVTFKGQRHPDEQQSDFLSSTDNWFRPSSLATGPDGSLWVADMYRHVIEHPEWIPESWQAKLDLRAGDDRGRIYRVYRKDTPPTAIPDLTESSTGQLVKALADENGWIRDTTQQLLIEQDDPAAVAALGRSLQQATSPHAKVHALCTLDGLGALDSKQIVAALSDSSPEVQRRGVLLAEARLEAEPALVAALLLLVKHADIRVRYQLALTLGQTGDPRAGHALGELAVADLQDRWMRTAVLSSAAPHAAGILTTIVRTVKPSKQRAEIVQHLISTALADDIRGNVGGILAVISPTADAQVENWQIDALSSFLAALKRRKLSLQTLRKSADATVSQNLDQAARVIAAAQTLANDERAALGDRATAIRLLGQTGDDPQRVFPDFLTLQTPLSLQQAAVTALSATGSKTVPGILFAGWKQHSPALRAAILETLTARPDWTVALLDALESNTISEGDLDAATRTRLTSASPRTIRDRARKLLALTVNEDRQKVVAAHSDVNQLPGNALRGAALFSQTCGSCHRHRERGNEIGAKLSALKDKSNEALLIAILDPNRAVEGKYRNYLAATTDGRVYSGMIVTESTSSITLASPNGKQDVILRVDLDELNSTGQSFMPEGLEKDLGKQDLADIFTFLQSTTAPQQTLDDERVAANRKAIRDAGAGAFTQRPASSTTEGTDTWLGRRPTSFCGHPDNKTTLRWTSPPRVQPDDDGKPYRFRFPVVIRNTAAPSERLTLSINGSTATTFTLSAGDAQLTSDDSAVSLEYLAVAAFNDDSSGLLDVIVPARLITPKKPVEFEVSIGPTSKPNLFGLILDAPNSVRPSK